MLHRYGGESALYRANLIIGPLAWSVLPVLIAVSVVCIAACIAIDLAGPRVPPVAREGPQPSLLRLCSVRTSRQIARERRKHLRGIRLLFPSQTRPVRKRMPSLAQPGEILQRLRDGLRGYGRRKEAPHLVIHEFRNTPNGSGYDGNPRGQRLHDRYRSAFRAADV